MYNWISLLCTWNIVSQLYFSEVYMLRKKRHVEDNILRLHFKLYRYKCGGAYIRIHIHSSRFPLRCETVKITIQAAVVQRKLNNGKNYDRSVTFQRCCQSIKTSRWCRGHRRHGFNPWVGKISWRRKWQPTPMFLPGKSHGQRSPAATVHGVTNSRTQLSTHTHWCHTAEHFLADISAISLIVTLILATLRLLFPKFWGTFSDMSSTPMVTFHAAGNRDTALPCLSDGPHSSH